MTKAFVWEDQGLRIRRLLFAGSYAAILVFLTGLLFDYYFDLNDDVLIKDILAGVQTGTPSGYSIQMLYPVSVLISSFYRLARGVDWFGLFLCACQFGSFFAIAQRSLLLLEMREYGAAGREGSGGRTAGHRLAREAALLLFQGILVYGMFLRELVFVQYTVTCGLLTAAGTFLLFTSPEDGTDRQFWRRNLPAMLMLVAAFNIRTEMFLLLSPYLGAAGMIKWLQEGFSRKMRRYLTVIAIVAAGMAAGYGVNMAAYSGPEWKEFLRVFHARTQIYDYYGGAPSYEEHADFYEEAGLGREGYTLLNNYNYGIDETIDAQRMEQVEEYAAVVYASGHDREVRLAEASWEYKQRLLCRKDMPYTGMALFGYFFTAAVLLGRKKPLWLWQPALLFLARGVPWLYILYGGRVVDRITRPLYLTELLLLAGMAWRALTAKAEPKAAEAGAGEKAAPAILRAFFATAAFVLGIWGLCMMPGSLSGVRKEQAYREQYNAPYQELTAYLRRRPERYYYLDVYSTVYFSEKMYEKVDNSKRNYDIIGGWACKSPLSGTEAFRYFVADSKWDAAWLADYYKNRQPGTQVRKADRLETQSGIVWDIYEIIPVMGG